jgi:hypothetical protein
VIKPKFVGIFMAVSFYQMIALSTLALGSSHLRAQSDAKPSEQLSCTLALKLASMAFNRANSEKRKKNEHLAYELRLGFWDVYSLYTHCPEVNRLAMRLTAMGLAADSKPPVGSTYAGPLVWPKGSEAPIQNCPPGMKCGWIKGGGTGIGQGSEKQDVFVVPRDFQLPANPAGKQ